MATTLEEFDLDRVRIASPCDVGWANMQGDERVRFCKRCQMHVYNLSGMTRNEAESLLRHREGRMCVSIFRRLDGTILTADCPIGLRLARRAMAKATGLAAVCASFVFAVSLGLGLSQGTVARLRDLEPFKWISTWFAPPAPAPSPPARFGTRSDGMLVP
jgi:hypothetical protein